MRKIPKFLVVLCMSVMSLVSCVTKEVTFDTVWHYRTVDNKTINGLKPKHDPYYVGSDTKYHYFIYNGYDSKRLKVKRNDEISLYPCPSPFRGWDKENWQSMTLYNGRVVLTPLSFLKRASAGGEKLVGKSEQERVKKMNDWYIHELGQDRLNIPDRNGVPSRPIYKWIFQEEDYQIRTDGSTERRCIGDARFGNLPRQLYNVTSAREVSLEEQRRLGWHYLVSKGEGGISVDPPDDETCDTRKKDREHFLRKWIIIELP